MADKVKIAKILSQIHSSSYAPYYTNGLTDFWSTLEKKTLNPNDVDQDFFIKMSDYVYKSIKKSVNRTEDLAIILSRVHSHSLIPFYQTNQPDIKEDVNEWDGYSWNKLETKSKNDSNVDKEFFLSIAEEVMKFLID